MRKARYRCILRQRRQCPLRPENDRQPSKRDLSLCANSKHRACAVESHVFRANAFAIFRAWSIKSCTTGLTARFFKVMTPTGQGGTGRSTGKTLNRRRFTPNLKTEPGHIARKGPFATRAMWRWIAPKANSSARIFKAVRTKGLAEYQFNHCVMRRQSPRLVGQLGKIDLATTCPRIFQSHNNKSALVEQISTSDVLVDLS